MNALRAYAEAESLPRTEPGRIARFLNLEDAEHLDEIALARRVAQGLPIGVVAALGDVVGRRRLVGTVASEATLHRHRRSGKALSRSHSERVYGLVRVLDAVARVFHGDVARINDFIDRPHPLLDGESPLDMATCSSAGADAVLNLVLRAEAGVAV